MKSIATFVPQGHPFPVREHSKAGGLAFPLVFRVIALLAAFWLVLAGGVLRAQDAATPQPSATEALRPVLNRIGEVMVGLNVGKWKAPGEVRSVAQRDIDSIQRDLSSTLPPLLDQAAKPPVSVGAEFAVYRNIDALYDVLLRVSETATLAGSPTDSNNLQGTLTSLEAARRQLGDSILQLAGSREEELNNLRTAAAEAAAAAAAKPAPPTKTVVDDGPAAATKPASAPKHKKKPAPTPPPTAPPQ